MLMFFNFGVECYVFVGFLIEVDFLKLKRGLLLETK